MSREDEELDLLIEHRQLTRAFLEAKAAFHADPSNKELRAAKVAAGEALRAHRSHWRRIREYLAGIGELDVPVGDAVAAPDTVSLDAGVQ